ncbi:MAG TPA: L,D-transpeptidase family protein, partial [Acidimicrobiales bacterium]|nr:L,D-transpeptidase family protein [Acidimicrobiales bacterium]
MAGPIPVRKLTLAVACLAVGLSGCITRVEPASDAQPPTPPTTSAPPPTAAAVVEPPPAPAPTVGAAPPPPPGLGTGARGADVQTLEQRLADLRYDPGKVDGVFDSTTGHAVMAFQKVQGMARTGRATPDVVTALSAARSPDAMLPGGGPNRVEIDLQRQVLLLWQSGSLTRVLPVSTGTGKRYCVDGQCAKAVTPGGSFRVTRKILGLRVSRLGR